jgi:2,5-diketo-D-gluconate reductase A
VVRRARLLRDTSVDDERNDTARKVSARHGIAVEAWSPLGQGTDLHDAVINRLATNRGRSNSQIILRWYIQRADIVIPKSMRREHMERNVALFDFELSTDEIVAIDALDQGDRGRIGPHPDTFDWIP